MVTFTIGEKDNTKVTYRYYPENRTDRSFGIISVCLENGDVTIDTLAEEDFICRTSADELNSMRDAINEMRKENEKLHLTEVEMEI